MAVVIAHPDDEVFASNLLLGISQHERVHLAICCVTDGGGGSLRGDPPLVRAEDLGAYRLNELKASVAQYCPWRVQVLGWEDTGFSGPSSDSNTDEYNKALRKTITSALNELRADVVITHGTEGEYGHPLHRAVHGAVCEDAAKHSRSVVTFRANTGYNVWEEQTNRRDLASFMLCADNHPYHKEQSVEAHQTQWQYFTGKQPSQRAYRQAVYRYATDHACEGYRLVRVMSEHENRLLHILRSAHGVRLTTVERYQEPLIAAATMLWRMVERFKTLRYRLALRTRLRRFINTLLQT